MSIREFLSQRGSNFFLLVLSGPISIFQQNGLVILFCLETVLRFQQNYWIQSRELSFG